MRIVRRVAIVGVPPVRALDVFGPAEVFGDANWLRGGDPAYEVTIISACRDRVVPSYIAKPLLTDKSFREFRGPVDTLLVAGSVGEMRYEEGFLDWLREQSGKARRFGSICTGALMLAKAGLLTADARQRTGTGVRNWPVIIPRLKWMPLRSMFAGELLHFGRDNCRH